jgi:hypothetical protein
MHHKGATATRSSFPDVFFLTSVEGQTCLKKRQNLSATFVPDGYNDHLIKTTFSFQSLLSFFTLHPESVFVVTAIDRMLVPMVDEYYY